MASNAPINFAQKLALFDEAWSPRVVAEMNDYQFKLFKARGEFVWHQHDDTDELFFVHKGVLNIKYEDRDVVVRAGEMHVVPKGTPHKPVAEEECEILLIEPAGTLNTGEVESALTATEEPWI